MINQKAGLADLEARCCSGHGKLFVLYGRRCVGQTEFLCHFYADKSPVCSISKLSSALNQLDAFSQDLWHIIHADALARFSPCLWAVSLWEAASRTLADLPGRLIVVLDEFTYLINRNLPSLH